MNEPMKQVAESGDINALYQLIGEYVNLLDNIDELPFVQTPLHIAASAGHIQFATDLMGLKPSFAWKLNPNEFSPIHLALQNGHFELVRRLLQFDKDLVRVKGKECLTPLHYVVATADHHLDLLEKFLLVCPDSIADVTVRNETALHIALKYDQFKAFKFLVEWLGRNWFKNASLNEDPILNWKDNEGNTVLHIAVSKNQTQVVSHLFAWGSRFVDVNNINLKGKTAWDISQGQSQVDNTEIRLMLHSAGASSGSSITTITRSDDNNIDEFYTLIGEDVKLLEHIDELPFVNTPLHIAASYGNIQFAKEMMGLKPLFARKLNQNGFSPIHLALKNEHIELVHQLLQFDGNLVRVPGRGFLTPLHYLVATGDHHLDLLRKFLLACPDSIVDLTVRNETVLHIALKYDMLKTFAFFVEWLGMNWSKNGEFYERSVLNRKDDKGNTVLHIAVLKNQTKAVRHLLFWGCKFFDVNHKNLEDKTAWDILQGQTQVNNSEIRVMLHDAKAKPASSLPTLKSHPNNQRAYCLRRFVHWRTDINREIRILTEEKKNILLMTVILLATLSFQVVLTPPGGLWQDNGQCVNVTEVLGSSHHNGSNHLTPFNITTVGSSNHPVIIHLTSSNTTVACEHKAGTAVALKDPFFNLFLNFSFVTFTLSNALMVLLAPNGKMMCMFFGLHFTLSVSYGFSVGVIIDNIRLGMAVALDSAYLLFVAMIISWKQ